METPEDKEERKQALLAVLEINKSGYGGVMPNGNIVDRRLPENRKAIPIQENRIFGVPKPLPVNYEKEI